jgi:tetratricopeptide (TPR) repeat protein
MRKAQEISLPEAAAHILHTCNRHQRPFFFLAGAGVSYPPVPLAAAIVEACKKECGAAEPPPHLAGDPMKEYSWWFQQAYHSPSDRQGYLRSIIENRFVSPANLRLAHLLLSRKISNLVVTTNFDDFISKSLTVFGEPHIVCDHPETIQRIDPENDDLQIVHVHGTYWFYDCCNLEGEIESRSRKSLQTASSMADFLDRILSNRSPLVLGYSGWSGDVFMTALKRRLRRGLAYNIYWFCYQRAAIQTMPEELRQHPDVFFVVPPSQRAGGDALRGRTAEVRKDMAVQTSGEPTLPASEVLDALVTTFQLPAPPLTRDPLGFFADQLRRSLPQDAVTPAGRDIYLIRKVIKRIELAGRSLGATELKLESVRDALRRSQYKEAIHSGLIPLHDELDDDQARELADALYLAASKLSDEPEEELAAYTRVVSLGTGLLASVPDDLALREVVAKALVNRGNLLGDLKRPEEAFQSYDDVLTRFGSAAEPSLRYQVARAMYNKGATYGQIEQQAQALEAYRAMLDRFRDAAEPGVRDLVAWSTYQAGISLDHLQQPAEAEKQYREVVERFASDATPDCREVWASAMNALGDNAVIEAKKVWIASGEQAAVSHLRDAGRCYATALERAPDHPYLLGSQAYAEFLLGNREQARRLLARAIPAGGEELRSAVLEFAFQQPLPEDDDFKALLDSIPAAPPGPARN